MHAFRRTRRGYATRMDATERAIVGSVVKDVAELLGYGVAADSPPADDGLPALQWNEPDPAAAKLPHDPALARLLPAASDDEDVATELRHLTEESIRSAKGERLRRVWWDLQGTEEEIRIDADQAMAWAGSLTDVRLVLASRLGVEDAEGAQALEEIAASGDDEVSRALATLYLALSWLQESLVEAMLADLPDTPEA